MEIKILGPGCAKCEKTAKLVQAETLAAAVGVGARRSATRSAIALPGPAGKLFSSSTSPKMSILTVLQKLIDFLTSARETSWGVVTMMALASEMVWATVNGSSPVPGGASIIRKSKFPQSISPINCLMAENFNGPRQIIASSLLGVKDSIEMAFNVSE